MRCACGCGTEIVAISKHDGSPKRFAHGHNWRGQSRGGMTYEQKLGKMVICKCGCGESMTQYRIKADGKRYKVSYQRGHNRRGAAINFWKGGVTEAGKRFKASGKYRHWRKAVFERDNYTCVECGIRNQMGLGRTVELHADHIKPFSVFIKLRTELSNGRTLCADCHRQTPTYGPRVKKVMMEKEPS